MDGGVGGRVLDSSEMQINMEGGGLEKSEGAEAAPAAEATDAKS